MLIKEFDNQVWNQQSYLQKTEWFGSLTNSIQSTQRDPGTFYRDLCWGNCMNSGYLKNMTIIWKHLRDYGNFFEIQWNEIIRYNVQEEKNEYSFWFSSGWQGWKLHRNRSHSALRIHTPEKIPLNHCLADPSPDSTTFLCESLCNTLLAKRNLKAVGSQDGGAIVLGT